MSGINQNPKGRSPFLSRRLLSMILVVTGILLILVPFVLTRINSQRNDDIIDEFLQQADQAASDADIIAGERVEPLNSSVPTELQSPEEQTVSTSAIDSTEPSDEQGSTPPNNPTMSKDEIKSRMTGVLMIDKIDLRMVMMDGVDEATLRVAAGRMPETNKPDEVGNCVLAGHRSYTFGKYFNRLDELELGDEIIIKTKDKDLKYEVFKKFIVEPDDFSITDKDGNNKILTLFTCHPVAVATHRLVVQANQIE